MYMQDVKGVKTNIHDKDKLLLDYERRLEASKHLIQQKEAEFSSTKMQLLDLYDQFSEEQDKNQKLQLKLSNLERENKALEVRYNSEAEERVRLKDDQCDHELRKMTNKLREAEKRIEVLKINADERINLAIDNKDKEIQVLKGQIERFKMEHEVEMSKMEQRVADLKSESQNKEKNLESFKG